MEQAGDGVVGPCLVSDAGIGVAKQGGGGVPCHKVGSLQDDKGASGVAPGVGRLAGG